MNPSERIDAIKEIAHRLSAEGWTLIDLTLKQFGLPVTDEWRGDTHSYVVEMIGNAEETQLRDLARHVGVEIHSPALGIEPPFWLAGHLRVFLSHLAEHRAYAAELKDALTEYGLGAFVAHNDIEPTAEWQNEIEVALMTCEVCLALLHKGFRQSAWADQEVGMAMGRRLPVFSVRFNEDPYGFIGRLQAFNGRNKSTAHLAKEIFDVLRSNKQTQRRMSEVVVALFENSYSFKKAKANMSLLEQLEVWDGSYGPRLERAIESSSQVSEAFGVPERVKRLVEKWGKSGF